MNREARRTSQGGRAIETLRTARALGGTAIDPASVRRLRGSVSAKMRERASIVAKARRAGGNDLAERHGLALRERLAEHGRRIEARRTPADDALTRLGAAAHRGDEPIRVRLEFLDLVDPSRLMGDLRQALGLESGEGIEKNGVKLEPLTQAVPSRVFDLTVDVSHAEFGVAIAPLVERVRSATGAARATGVPPASALTRFRRLVGGKAGLHAGKWRFTGPAADEPRCCCCCCCCHTEAGEGVGKPAEDHEQARPTWPSTPADTEWHLKQMRVKEAWGIAPPAGGASKGRGIVIAHPDTGWREHPEFDEAQLRFDLARNVMSGRNGKGATRHGTVTLIGVKYETHGTVTGATIVGAEATGQTHVDDIPSLDAVATSSNVQLTGVAPNAELVPIRCTDNVVLLFDSNIHKAIQHAIDIEAHVISISLGGVLDSDAERVIDKAVLEHNIIVVGAAGQYVNQGTNSVVEPANFTNVIAVAGSTPAARPWSASCNGPKVAVSAPADRMWIAHFLVDGTPGIYKGEGTSLAAAQVAGVAALWLAHWGRKSLIERYGEVPLAHVFRHVLRKTAWRPRHWNSTYGAGIVDAYALLKEPLPAKDEIAGPTDTDEFNLFDTVSDLVDLGGGVATWIWDAAVSAADPIGDFFAEVFAINTLSEGLAVLGALAEVAAGEAQAWANEQTASLWATVDDSLEAAAEAWEAIAAGGEEAVEATGDLFEQGRELMEDTGERGAEVWGQAVDLFESLW